MLGSDFFEFFLSRVFGGEQYTQDFAANLAFLSRVFGGELPLT